MKKELNVMICGSQKFDDKVFVYGMLDALSSNNVKFSNIIVGKYSGACKFAEQWVQKVNEERNLNIGVKEFSYDMYLGKKNLSLYEQLDIPDFVIKSDPFFQEGKNKLIEQGVQLVMAFPNKEGILGASTLNILRFANLANLDVFDCSAALEQVNQYRKSQESELYVPPSSGNTLVNRNPGKKM